MKKEIIESIKLILSEQSQFKKMKLKQFTFKNDIYESIELIKYSIDTHPDCVVLWDEDEGNCRGIEDFDESIIMNIYTELSN